MNDAKEIKLHPTELYYLAFCVIDRMKGQSTSQAEFYSKDEAWYEYDEVLRDIYGGDSDHERHSALALIIQTCAEWLLRSRDMSRLGIVSNLKLQIAYHISEEFSQRLDEEFRRGFCCVDEDGFAGLVYDYLQGERLISEEIDSLLDSMDGDAVMENPSVASSSIRIAPRKKTSVLTVLNAMYKAGWFTDVDGNTLKNRDEALNDILRNAFGTDKDTAISQTLNPSNGTVKYKFKPLMEKLLDGKEIEQFIHDLTQELMENHQ
ncbi:MAG: hypothetical protein SO401_03555 [Blautia sp.]|uniref:hypothetical protein n=1 Tax=Anaerobutyricum hallii TaxID=39488 RepID=UPI00242D0B80|nr:hypothetical protein [Anaerobutyricum hallii]MDD6589018.1 hypothetical protein [Anaerobutyricum hallii]MDY4692626.1 hypothetical protein [Blautia sp.]